MNDFTEIPLNWRKPGTLMEIRPVYDNAGLLDFPVNVLIIAQASGGDAEPGKPYDILTHADAVARFGAGSIAADMVRVFRLNNREQKLAVMALAEPAGATAASSTITIGGAPAEAGAVCLYVAGVRVRAIVAKTSTPDAIAAALAAGIAANPDLAVTATVAANKLTVTAKCKGECGNGIDLRLNRRRDERLPVGLTVQIGPMKDGAGNPDIAAAWGVIANTWYNDIVIPWADGANIAELHAELLRRYVATSRKDAHGWMAEAGTVGQMIANKGDINCPYSTSLPAWRACSPGWVWAAALAGVATKHLLINPARQLTGLALAGVVGPDQADAFTDVEQNQLLWSGRSTFNVLDDGTVVIDRVVTTYQTSALGVSDRAWLDVMTPKTLTRIRYDWWAYRSLNFPRHLLANDGDVAAEFNDEVVTPKRMLGAWASRCMIYAKAAWIGDATRTIGASRFWLDPDTPNTLLYDMRVRVMGNLINMNGALGFEAG